jgi:hypothetical protein
LTQRATAREAFNVSLKPSDIRFDHVSVVLLRSQAATAAWLFLNC